MVMATKRGKDWQATPTPGNGMNLDDASTTRFIPSRSHLHCACCRHRSFNFRRSGAPTAYCGSRSTRANAGLWASLRAYFVSKVIQTFRWLLFASIVVIFTCDLTRNLLFNQCKYGEGTKYCELMTSVHRQNEENRHHLNVNHFDDAMSSLTNADHAIDVLLRRKKKAELLEPFRQALHHESSALFTVLKKCNNDVTKPPCSSIFRGLSDATIKLVEATIEVTDGEKNEKVQELYDSFKKEPNRTEKAYSLASRVLTALGQH